MAFEIPFNEKANEIEMKKNKNINPKELQKLKKLEIEPLTLEHILFPLVLWLAGLLLSALFLLAENLYKRITKSKTDVSMVAPINTNQEDDEDTDDFK